jgi:hypothetical protein
MNPDRQYPLSRFPAEWVHLFLATAISAKSRQSRMNQFFGITPHVIPDESDLIGGSNER